MSWRPLWLLLAAGAACTQPTPTGCTADGYPLDDGLLADCAPGPGLVAYAFTRLGDSVPALFLTRPDGTCHRRITGDGAYYGAPAFFPGGRRIAYASTRSGLNSLYLLDLTTGVETRIDTLWQLDPPPADPTPLAAAAPSVSPDGLTIAFEGSLGAYPGWSDVFTVPVAGGTVTRLTNSSGSTVPAWSPDGATVYFISFRTGNAELFSTPPDGLQVATQLTSGSGLSSKFAVSGDGAALLYGRFAASGTGSKPTELVALDLATSTIRVVSSANEADPAVDAGDTSIAVSRASDSGYDLYLLDYATGAEKRLLVSCPGQAFGAAVAR